MAVDASDSKSFLARLGNGFLALIGATTANEFPEKFQAAWGDLFTRLDAVEKRETPVAFDVKPFEARIAAMELSLKDAPTKENVEGWAKAAGSAEAVKAVSSVGLQPGSIVGASPTATETTNTTAKLVAEGKFAEAWAADAEIRKDFGSPERYAAFMRNIGSVAVFKKEKE